MVLVRGAGIGADMGGAEDVDPRLNSDPVAGGELHSMTQQQAINYGGAGGGETTPTIGLNRVMILSELFYFDKETLESIRRQKV